MSIPISNEVALVLLALFTAYMFYTNWSRIQILSSAKNKVLYSAIILAEIAIIAGSRFVTPAVIRTFVERTSPFYNLLDIGVFLVVLFATFKVGAILKERLG